MVQPNLLVHSVSILPMISLYEYSSILITGFFELKDGEIMFVRASIAPSNSEKDVALAWKTGGYV